MSSLSLCKMGPCPDSKVHGANMGPIWGRQDPGGPHVGPMNFAIRVYLCCLSTANQLYYFGSPPWSCCQQVSKKLSIGGWTVVFDETYFGINIRICWRPVAHGSFVIVIALHLIRFGSQNHYSSTAHNISRNPVHIYEMDLRNIVAVYTYQRNLRHIVGWILVSKCHRIL